MRLFGYVLVGAYILAIAIAIMIVYYGYTSWQVVLVPLLVALIAGLGRWAQIRSIEEARRGGATRPKTPS